MSTDSDLHPDFGPSYGDGPNYGIPITVVRSDHRKVRVSFQYAGESDKVRYPLGKDTRIEGGRSSSGRPARDHRRRGQVPALRDLGYPECSNGKWRAGSGAVWSLRSNALRRDGWTSADAAGLPILPGLLRWNEVRDDRIDHAIRFTTDETSRHHLWPARHDAGSDQQPRLPTDGRAVPAPGVVRRLRPVAEARIVVAAMKKYGLVLADNGSPWFFQGEQNSQWPERLIEDLKTIPASAFVAVDTSSLMVSENSAEVQ